MGRVRSFLDVVAPPRTDGLASLRSVLEVVQVDTLVLEGAPQTLDEDVVHPPTFAGHRDPYSGLLEDLDEVLAGELAALVGIEDSGFTICPELRKYRRRLGFAGGRTFSVHIHQTSW